MSSDETETQHVTSTEAPRVEPTDGAATRSPARNARLQLRMSAALKDRMREYAARRHTTLSALAVQSFLEMLTAEERAGGPAN